MKTILSSIVLVATINAIGTAIPATAGELQAIKIQSTKNLDRSPSNVNSALVATLGDSSRPRKKSYVSLMRTFGKNVKSPVEAIKDQTISEGAIMGKIVVSDNISIRPFISAGTGSIATDFGTIDFESASYGVSATYDLNIQDSGFIPYGGIGYASNKLTIPRNKDFDKTTSGIYVELGTDYEFTGSSIVLNANYKLQDGGGVFGLAVGYGF